MSIIASRIGRSAHADNTQQKTVYFKSATVGNYDTVKTTGDVAYQVTATKTFYIERIVIGGQNAGAQFSVGYGDTAVTDQVAAPTNPVRLTNLINKPGGTLPLLDLPIKLQVPAGKYPFIRNEAGDVYCSGFIEGFEA